MARALRTTHPLTVALAVEGSARAVAIGELRDLIARRHGCISGAALEIGVHYRTMLRWVQAAGLELYASELRRNHRVRGPRAVA